MSEVKSKVPGVVDEVKAAAGDGYIKNAVTQYRRPRQPRHGVI